MKFSAFIPMTPVAKARARVTRFGTYTPQKTKTAEKYIRSYLKYATKLEGPLELQIAFHLLKPKSCPKTRIYPTVKPDLDNYVKLVKDACNGILWTDDAQIVTIFAYKKYSNLEGFHLEVKEINDERV